MSHLLYAIRHKKSGRYIPTVFGIGKSRVEVTDHGPPRLFLTLGGAKTSLNMWSQGHWHTSREYEDGCYYNDTPTPSGKHERNKDDYEIVSVELLVRKLV